jgi:aspartate aminotransferase
MVCLYLVESTKRSCAMLANTALLGASQPKAGQDPIFRLLQDYRQDRRSNKLDLGIGVYRDHLNRSPIFAAVKQAEQWRVDTEEDKAYIGPLGDLTFCQLVTELALGESLAEQLSERIAYAQTPGGVGALRLAFELLKISNPDITLWVADTTWQVHHPIAGGAGLNVATYAYYDRAIGRLPFGDLLAQLAEAKPGDALLLQAGCHNPTGLDFSVDEWQLLAELCTEKQLLPVIDMAYHGLGVGVDSERQGLKIMAESLRELILCYTCSKNFGLYRERTGMVMALGASAGHQQVIEQQWIQLATQHYFTPPAHGASLVRRILQNDQLRVIWSNELDRIRQRLGTMRVQLIDALSLAVPQRSWDFLLQGSGMFAIFPLNSDEIKLLQKQYAIYIVDNGRINLSGVNQANMVRLVTAITAVIQQSEVELNAASV